MLTVLESINLSTEYLKNKGIDSPRINAELILAHILKLKRLELYLAFDRPLKEDEIVLYRQFLKRRSEFEPLQYILGTVNFFGLDLKISPLVLIPIPETELLAEEIINEFKDHELVKILDIGTGSGNIAITLAKFLPNSIITATDISGGAIDIATANAKSNGVSDRINFFINDIFSSQNLAENNFDIIVSNPPYVTSEDFKNLNKELKDYEPKAALTDDSNGLSFYDIISSKSNIYLKKGGKLFFELGHGLSENVQDIMQKNHFINISIKKDYQSIDRIIRGVFP